MTDVNSGKGGVGKSITTVNLALHQRNKERRYVFPHVAIYLPLFSFVDS
ncbi:MAG: P-loop NTPase [Arsenophonus sp. NC-TX2-MAG3]